MFGGVQRTWAKGDCQAAEVCGLTRQERNTELPEQPASEANVVRMMVRHAQPCQMSSSQGSRYE
jgi:hypothetical protein